ncbi:MAG: Putrescine--pyruvate aminotransferase [Gammaproteobacteria bacterium]|nr:Putrescine--pyruvate aminotransferase [Gammaproteobacteria bacterium]
MTKLNTDALHAMDRAHLFHPSTHMRQHADGETPNRIITGGQGVYIEDAEGKRLLDAFAGLYCVNIGYGRQEMAEAIYEQAKNLCYYHSYVGHGSEPAILLSEKIIGMAPKGMSRVYYGMSGSDANETQIKLVWYYNNMLDRPEKKKIISRWRGYHGSGVMTGSLTGLEVFHKAFDLPRNPILHTVCPHYYRHAEPGMSETDFSDWCANQLERLVLDEGPETVAAFIGEPVMGTGGLIPPPEGYWDKIQAVLDKYEVLLIADEVVTAFGRVGTPFASHRYNIRPDLITIAKGLTSAYLPLSGVIVSDDVWEVLETGSDKLGPIGHGWTYSAHPLCAASGLKNLEIIENEKLIENTADVGDYFQKRMHETFDDHPIVGEVRGVGLLGALEFAKSKERLEPFDAELKVAPRVANAVAERGVIARAMPHADIVGYAPPLVLTREQADKIVDSSKQAVDAVAKEIGV